MGICKDYYYEIILVDKVIKLLQLAIVEWQWLNNSLVIACNNGLNSAITDYDYLNPFSSDF